MQGNSALCNLLLVSYTRTHSMSLHRTNASNAIGDFSIPHWKFAYCSCTDWSKNDELNRHGWNMISVCEAIIGPTLLVKGLE